MRGCYLSEVVTMTRPNNNVESYTFEKRSAIVFRVIQHVLIPKEALVNTFSKLALVSFLSIPLMGSQVFSAELSLKDKKEAADWLETLKENVADVDKACGTQIKVSIDSASFLGKAGNN